MTCSNADSRKKTGPLDESSVSKLTNSQKLDIILAMLRAVSERLESVEINLTECLIALDEGFVPEEEDFILPELEDEE